MSVKEELIATALTAADELDRVYENAPVEQNSNDLREACARAMVQPDIGEVKNLVSAACNLMFDAGKLLGRRDAGADREVEDARSARTALLDYVRAIMAERDALIADKRDEIDENLRLRELGGALHDENITAMTERLIRERDQFRDAAKMVSTAPQPVGEVPMPDGDNLLCYQQGYAAGLAAGGKDAERYRWLRAYKIKHNGHCMALTGPILWEENLDDAIDAALRGEVKP